MRPSSRSDPRFRHRPPAATRWAASLFLLVWVVGCLWQAPAPRILRLGTLVDAAGGDSLSIASRLTLPAGTQHFVPVDLDAARFTALDVRARGSARSLQMAWKLAIDPRLRPYRRLDFPLLAEERSEQTYRVDLRREAYWTGRVEMLTLTAGGGDLEIVEVRAVPASSAYRDAALRGLSMPSLPGFERFVLPLPEASSHPSVSLAHGVARFETHLGLLPQYSRAGIEARFHAYVETPAGRTTWVDTVVRGSDDTGGESWQWLRSEVEVPRAGTLVLEVEGAEQARQGAFWGNPVLVSAGTPERLNLVLVIVDTLRYDVVGAYGDGDHLTPRLDELAARSLRFEHLYAPSPWTLPSTASLMTGLQPQTHGAGQRIEGFAPTGLTEAPHTLAEVLSRAGYFTIGLYNNIYLNPAFGLQQGFDRYASYEVAAEHLVDRALEELEANRDRHLFLLLHLFDPHNPYEPPPEDCQRVTRAQGWDYRDDLGCAADRRPELPLPPRADRPWIEALYRVEVAYTDRQIGRFLDGLEELGLGRRTVVAVVSDHGEDFWRRLEQQRAYGYRVDGDHGHTHYNELLQVPGILHVPGSEARVFRSAAELVDLYPTLLGLLGVPAPPSHGRDLRDHLSGGGGTAPLLIGDQLLYGRARWSVQQGRWKLISPHTGDGPIELFDLRSDPGETANLAGERQDVVRMLQQLGREELGARRSARQELLEGDDSLAATYLEWRHITKLRALGYLK